MLLRRQLITIASSMLLASVIAVPDARAAGFSLGDAATYAVLYEGTGGHTLQITNVVVNGNIGVGGTGQLTDSGPSTINGNVQFAAANTGQFHNNNIADVITGTVSYGNANVASALTYLNSLSTSFAAEAGASLAINVGNGGTQVITVNAGHLDGTGNYVFDLSSMHFVNGATVNIAGDGSHNAVFNIGFAPQFQGSIVLTGGITSDQILWNVVGGPLQLNNNGAAVPLEGVFLDPNGAVSVVHTTLHGRVFGGNSSDMQIVSGDTLTAQGVAPAAVPEPTSVFLLGSGLLAGIRRWRKRAA